MKPLEFQRGQRFGRLTVLRRVTSDYYGRRRWACRCVCGNMAFPTACALNSGRTRSCGCLMLESVSRNGSRRATHGHMRTLAPSPTYISWQAMRNRCRNRRYHQFGLYGGRGITICHQWDSFQQFLSDMGERPLGKSLDRIDNDSGYYPGNCRWATPLQQTLNRRVHAKAQQ